MKARHMILSIAALSISALAHATGVRAVDVPRVTEGSTGFIGATESVHTARRDRSSMQAARAFLPAGEASTLVDGRPNVHPELSGAAPAHGTWVRTMGAGKHRGWVHGTAAAVHPIAGTPD